jgi:hypothetical protein
VRATAIGNGLVANQCEIIHVGEIVIGASLMKQSILAGVLYAGFFATQTVFAANDTCYERVYDQAHLQKHELQEVTKIRLTMKQGDTISGVIAAAFRESPKYQSSEFECASKDKAVNCEVLADGGEFSFTQTTKGIRLVNMSMVRFGDEEDGVSIGGEAEHRIFLLFQVSPQTCAD